MEYLKKFFKIGAITFLGLGILGAFTAVGLYLYVAPRLPSIDSLKDTQFQVPLRIYSNDEKLIGEYGEKRRTPLDYDEVPKQLIQAVLGAEDDRFFEHPGVDYQGIVRAVALLVLTGQKVQGGSTITMQVARNFFLSREKTFLRKFSEILLSFKIEAELTKQEILELYLNKIYLGNRAYGVAAAAQVYYGKDIRQLNVAQLAMIAGLPKAPSRYNPIINPERALLRRNYVLGRMQELGYIEEPVYQFAVQEPVTAEMHGQTIEAEATYAAEMVRREMVERYGNEAYTQGYIVHTTIEADLQESANKALRKALLEFETRHGYRGPLFRAEDELDFSNIDEWEEKLSTMEENPMLQLGVVTELVEDGGKQGSAIVFTNDNQLIEICWNGLKWAAPYIDGNQVGFAPKKVSEILQKGDVIHFFIGDKNVYTLGQLPEVEGALVSVRSKDASIISIVGGYNFYRSKFNRAEQAERQPGSNFKPFVYSAALEKGFTAGTLINDAPVVFQDPGLEDTWRPENYSGKFFGPTRLREALVKSRNLVSIRILRSIGVRFAIEYVQKFGFNPDKLPKDLSLALGSASLTPLE
ncbi:MAG: transglycosylase domain-containing protein, partial [Nitrosopumilus sp.]|nr:transglycosylase domain-containing protein [Nitrosopumilus sp.]